MHTAIGFDFGHTLAYNPAVALSWTDHYCAALRHASRESGVSLSDGGLAAACRILQQYNTRANPRTKEVSSDEIFSSLLREAGVADSVLVPFSSAFFGYFEQTLVLFDDALPALRSLRSAGLRIGVLTDVPYGKRRDFVDRELRNLGDLLANVDEFLTSVEVGHRKPSPIGLHTLADRLGARAADMAYVGDEPKDVSAAQAAGMVAILLDRTGMEPRWGQDYTISSLAQILPLISNQPLR